MCAHGYRIQHIHTVELRSHGVHSCSSGATAVEGMATDGIWQSPSLVDNRRLEATHRSQARRYYHTSIRPHVTVPILGQLMLLGLRYPRIVTTPCRAEHYRNFILMDSTVNPPAYQSQAIPNRGLHHHHLIQPFTPQTELLIIFRRPCHRFPQTSPLSRLPHSPYQVHMFLVVPVTMKDGHPI